MRLNSNYAIEVIKVAFMLCAMRFAKNLSLTKRLGGDFFVSLIVQMMNARVVIFYCIVGFN